jgi:hypothetical protein
VGHVGARDQQHERDRSQQHQQRPRRRCRRPLLERRDHHGAIRAGELLLEAGRDRRQLGARLLHADARLRARDTPAGCCRCGCPIAGQVERRHSSARVAQKGAKRNARGITPRIVYGRPSSAIVLPRICGSPAKRRCHSRSRARRPGSAPPPRPS